MAARICPQCEKPLPDDAHHNRTFHVECSGNRKRARERVVHVAHGGEYMNTALTRRCRNKDCIERFIPVNPQHWYHEPACAKSDNLWDVEDILREEGALLPGANQLELAKRAFGQKNQALRKLSTLASLREYLSYEIKSFHDERPELRYPTIPKPPKDRGKAGEVEIIVQLSDWQVGKWENGYGVESTIERIERCMASIAAIVQRQRAAGWKVNRIILAFGGDMIEGCYIYKGQNVSGLDKTGNTHRLTRQIITAAEQQAKVAAFCATLVDHVTVEAVGGNHGRPNGPNDYADPEDNFDVMSAWWSRDIVGRNNPRITWNIHEDWWGGFESMGHYFVSMHGDQWRGPLTRLEKLLPSWVTAGVFGGKPDVVLAHHRHTAAEMEVAGIQVMQNGTIDGGSNWYLKNYGGYSRPHQRIIAVTREHCPESTWPVRFDA